MQKDYQKVLSDVFKAIRPKPEERKQLKDLAEKTIEIANQIARPYHAKAILVGSLARDTWRPEKREFDVFLLFPPSISEKRFEKYGLEIGKKVVEKLKGTHRIEYAQHPYVRGSVGGVEVDIVPCYEVESPAKLKSAVDRTPFHQKYVQEHLPSALAGEVLLLKQFLDANWIYGADAKTEGFSGYVCELLIINYGKFIDVLKSAVKWSPGQVIDVESYYPKTDYPKLVKKFRGQSLILIDPTDKKRNTAAAISSQNFFVFKKLASQLLANPSGGMFFRRTIEPVTESELEALAKRRGTELTLVKLRPPNVVPDILWPQLRKFADRLEQILKEYQFVVLGKDVWTNEKDVAVVLLEMEVSRLPAVQKRIGPEIFDADGSAGFIEKYRDVALAGPFVENNFWCVEVKRNFLTSQEKLVDSLKEKVDILKAKGIPNHLAEQIAKTFEVIDKNTQVMGLVREDKSFGIFLRRYFEKGSLA